jgi:hypothetical protein
VEAAGKAAQKAAQKTLADDVAPRLTAAQTAALAYAAPRVAAARHAVTPALESAREALEARREELAASTAQATKKAKKLTAKQRKQLEKKAAKATRSAKRKVGVEPEPAPRWPWLIAVLGIAAVVAVLLRRRKGNDDLWPASTGDGPVPSYREDPVPSSPSDSGKTVSSAQSSAGDATPADSDLGTQPAQMASPEDKSRETDVPGTATGGPTNDELNTMFNSPTGNPADAEEEPGGERG